MPDDATVGAVTVAADELRTVNGQAQSEPLPKAQRIRPVHGTDGDAWDTSQANPLPVTAADVVAALAAVQTELASKLEAGQPVALDAAALAALEQVTATLSGPVALDATTLAALESITATLTGTVGVRQVGVAPPLGYAQASVTAAQALPTIPANTVTALVVPRAAIRWRDDGTNPTAAVGMYLAADQPLEYRGGLAAFRMISVSGTAEVNVSFYGAEA